MQVHVVQADLPTFAVDAIVNPTNSHGVMKTGVGGAIRVHGGDDIQAAATAKAPIAVGAALVTHAGSLQAKHIIHVPTAAEPDIPSGVENVRRAARAALIAAYVNQFQSIAMPGLGTGGGAVAMDEAARAIVEEIRAHKKPFPASVYLVDADGAMVHAFEDALRNAQLAF